MPGGSIPHWPWYRRTISKWGNRYATLVLGIPIRDATSGYRAFRADILKTADFANTRSKGYGFQIELCYRVWQHGGRIAQVPITFTDRVRGHSKMSLSVGAEELGLVTWWALQDRVLKRPLAPLTPHRGYRTCGSHHFHTATAPASVRCCSSDCQTSHAADLLGPVPVRAHERSPVARSRRAASTARRSRRSR